MVGLLLLASLSVCPLSPLNIFLIPASLRASSPASLCFSLDPSILSKACADVTALSEPVVWVRFEKKASLMSPLPPISFAFFLSLSLSLCQRVYPAAEQNIKTSAEIHKSRPLFIPTRDECRCRTCTHTHTHTYTHKHTHTFATHCFPSSFFLSNSSIFLTVWFARCWQKSSFF